MKTLTSGVRVGNVSYGKGVFAQKSFQPGESLGMVRGKVITDPSYASAYCIDLGANNSLEPYAPFRYLNHRCEPNAELMLHDVENDDGTPAPCTVELFATQHIAVGDEVTIDYKWGAEGAIECLCGSKACRGWVICEEELPKFLKERKSRKVGSTPKKPR